MSTSPNEIVFNLTIDTQDIRARYRPDYISGNEPYAVLEFISPHEPRRPKTMSTSGYSSFFAPTREIESAPSIERYACIVALLLGRDYLALKPSKRGDA
jgi:hypothetical protein